MKFITMNFLRRNFGQNCRAVEADLWDYAEGRLSEDKLERVEKHLLLCTPCRLETEGFAQAQAALIEVGQEMIPAPRTGWHELERRLDLEPSSGITYLEETPHHSPGRSLLGVLAPVSSVATLFMVGILFYQNQNIQQKLTQPASTDTFAMDRHGNEKRNPEVAKTDLTQAHSEETLENLFDTGAKTLQRVKFYTETPGTNSVVQEPAIRRKRQTVSPSQVTKAKSETTGTISAHRKLQVEKKSVSTAQEFKFHAQKPTSAEHTEVPVLKRGYVSNELVPVSNDDTY